jgi:hypothetical protein
MQPKNFQIIFSNFYENHWKNYLRKIPHDLPRQRWWHQGAEFYNLRLTVKESVKNWKNRNKITMTRIQIFTIINFWCSDDHFKSFLFYYCCKYCVNIFFKQFYSQILIGWPCSFHSRHQWYKHFRPTSYWHRNCFRQLHNYRTPKYREFWFKLSHFCDSQNRLSINSSKKFRNK